MVGDLQTVYRPIPLFKDTVSQAYSSQFGDNSGADLCGPQSYMLYELVNSSLQMVDFAFLTLFQGQD